MHHIFKGEFAVLEELLHQLILSACGGLHDGLAGGLDLVGDGGGDVDLLQGLALADEGLVFQHAHHAGELAVLNDRHLDGGDVAAVLLGDGGERLLEVGVLAIHLVDDDHAGGVGLVAHGPGLLRADIQAGDGAHGDDGALAHGQRAGLLTGEIEVSGDIDQIDLGVLPLQRSHGGADGNAALGLFGLEVGGGGAVLNAALAIDRARREQKCLDQSGLAFAAMSDNGKVADVLGLIVFHKKFPLFAIFSCNEIRTGLAVRKRAPYTPQYLYFNRKPRV